MPSASKNDRVIAALSYIFILFLIPMGRKNDAFCQFHARQGALLFIAWVLTSIIGWIPVIGQVAILAMLIVNVMAIMRTLDGKKWEIPLISKYAKLIK